jgi:WD40 repeat protein/transcriptional regulator with XRE-family HTH domain
VTTRPPFHEQLRYERELRGWSQADLAEKVRCDTKTVGRWESGDRIPRPYHRQSLCEIFEKNAEELGLVKENARKIKPPSSPGHKHYVPEGSPFPTPTTAPSQPPMLKEVRVSDHLSPSLLREDWGEAPYVVNLYGRDEECTELTHWIEDHHCQIVAVLGIGGVGKTAVATKVATQMKLAFEYVFWRSLQNALPLEIFLKQCISFVSDQQHLDLPREVDDQISLLIHYMRDHHCLLVLDNFESVLQPGRRAGHFREGYAAYGRLLQRVGVVQHQSCLLLTSREKPKEVAHLEGKNSPVRSLHLSGLRLEAGHQLLQDKGLVGSDAHWLALVERYSGNPLALQVVSESIQEVFEGNIGRFLQEEAIAFGDINDLLDQQFHRLSGQEREIMYWLAIEREPASLDGLRGNLVYPMSIGAQIEALDSLRRRSLIETRGLTQFTLQPVIMEYVTKSLIKRAYKQFVTEAPEVWIHFALCKAQAKDYVRESQVRLLLEPIAQRLLARLGKEGIEQRVRNMLTSQRQMHTQQSGYLAGNILNLLSYLHCDLRGVDFSHLVVRQAYLQGVMLLEANFAHARFVASIFSNTFGNILSVACSPREHLLAAGTTTGEIWIYDALSGVPRLTCHGHTDGVWSLAFSPDGSLLASSGDDHTVRLWDSHSGHCLRILQDHTNRVRAIAFSPDGSTLASGSDDKTIRLWDINTGHCLKTLLGHTGRVWSVAYSPVGDLLASGSTDQTARLWDTNTGSCFTTLRGHSGWVRSVAFHAKERVLASGSDDQTLRLWNVSTGDCLKTLPGHTSRVWCVAFHPASDIVASSSEDQTIRLWNIHTGRCLMSLQGHTQGVRSVAFIPGSHTLASGGDDQTIRLWDVANGHCLQIVQGYTNRVWSIDLSTDGSILASGSEDSIIRLWDVKTGHCLKTMQDRNHGVMVVAFSPRGFRLASGGQDQTIRVWDGNTGRSLSILRGHTNWVRTVIFSPDGNTLASGSEDQTIRLWDINTGSCTCLLQGHTSWVRSVAFSPDGNMLASGADDQMIRLWDVTDGRCLRTLQGHTNRVRAIVFSPDGNTLASGSEDQTIRLWDVRTGHCFNTLQGHSGWIRSVAFSPDGNTLASGGEDQTVRLWDVNTWQCLQTLRSHSNRVRWVTFSPDGRTLASSSDDGTVKLWDIQTATCLKTFISERPYERMNITGVQGLTEAQKANLRALGAIEES